MQCPSCHKEVTVEDKNIGALFTCPQCQSVYFINFDGTADYGQAEEFNSDELQEIISQQTHNPKKKVVSNDITSNEVEFADYNQEFEVADVQIESLAEPLVGQNKTENFNLLDSSASELSSALKDIESFGNQETQLSALSYNLTIEEIDTAEIRGQVLDVLSDYKLKLNLDSINQQVSFGVIHLNDLTGIQSYILIKQLQFLDLKMKWVQNVL